MSTQAPSLIRFVCALCLPLNPAPTTGRRWSQPPGTNPLELVLPSATMPWLQPVPCDPEYQTRGIVVLPALDDDILWLAFSSRRDYPIASPGYDDEVLYTEAYDHMGMYDSNNDGEITEDELTSPTDPQIWIVGINPELAMDGEDPSSSPIWFASLSPSPSTRT